jgi:hypothetical protein
MIHNPVFRYIHRAMSCTIFGRAETGTVRSDKLFILWAMVNKCAVNAGYYLLSHLASGAAQPKGKIVVGGLISFIAWKMGAEVATEENHIERNYVIDLDFCKQIHMVWDIDGKRTNFQLLIFNEDLILLPNPLRTDTTNLANWLYLDLDPHVPQEQPVQDEDMGDNQEEQQPIGGMQDDDDWRGTLEAKVDKINEELLLQRQMLVATM